MGKITFGLSNLYYATVTESEGGTITYGTPVAWPGARELSLSATGEPTQVYADDMVYVTINPTAGYDGDLTMLTIPETFYTDVLGMTTDENGVLVESENDNQNQFALLGEFKSETTDRKRFVLYNCSANKPDFGGTTKEEGVEAYEFTIAITATAANDTGAVKCTVTNATETKTQFDGWFTEVYVPSLTPGA
jgi:phi13 family phage major tail protein